MEFVEHGIEPTYETSRLRRWWRNIHWNRVCFILLMMLVLYDILACIVLSIYVRFLNKFQESRLEAMRHSSTFMKWYYFFHHYLGDPTLQHLDLAKLRADDEL